MKGRASRSREGGATFQLPSFMQSRRRQEISLTLTRAYSLAVFTSRYGNNLSGVTGAGAHAK